MIKMKEQKMARNEHYYEKMEIAPMVATQKGIPKIANPFRAVLAIKYDATRI
jgi:hypothetical protein